MKLRVVQFPNGKYAIQKVHRFLFWTWGGEFKSVTEGFWWKDYIDVVRFCQTDDKERLLDYVDNYNSSGNGLKVITRTPLEKALK
jgi:hypothetical protein